MEIYDADGVQGISESECEGVEECCEGLSKSPSAAFQQPKCLIIIANKFLQFKFLEKHPFSQLTMKLNGFTEYKMGWHPAEMNNRRLSSAREAIRLMENVVRNLLFSS